MKKWQWIVLVLGALLIIGKFAPKKDENKPAIPDNSAQDNVVKDSLIAGIERMVLRDNRGVKDVLFQGDILYVTVVDDKTSRNGLAEHYCGLVKEYWGDLAKVRIMKAGSINDPNRYNAYGVLLGEWNCK